MRASAQFAFRVPFRWSFSHGQTRNFIKEYADDQLVYIQCLAHCNELIIEDVIANCSLLSHATLMCQDVYVLAGASPERIFFPSLVILFLFLVS